jgi:hypothetical protein
MKYGQKLKLGDAHVTTRNIKEVQASKLGDAQGTPSSSTNIKSCFKTLYVTTQVSFQIFGIKKK